MSTKIVINEIFPKIYRVTIDDKTKDVDLSNAIIVPEKKFESLKHLGLKIDSDMYTVKMIEKLNPTNRHLIKAAKYQLLNYEFDIYQYIEYLKNNS